MSQLSEYLADWRVTAQEHRKHCGLHGKHTGGIAQDYEMVRGGTKGRERDGSRWSGKEQAWQNSRKMD